MSPRTKSTEFPAVRVSPKLKAETEMFAEDAQENLSEYIRKAVEERNKRYRADVDIGNRAIEWARQNRDGTFPIIPLKSGECNEPEQIESLVNFEVKKNKLQRSKPKK